MPLVKVQQLIRVLVYRVKVTISELQPFADHLLAAFSLSRTAHPTPYREDQHSQGIFRVNQDAYPNPTAGIFSPVLRVNEGVDSSCRAGMSSKILQGRILEVVLSSALPYL